MRHLAGVEAFPKFKTLEMPRLGGLVCPKLLGGKVCLPSCILANLRYKKFGFLKKASILQGRRRTSMRKILQWGILLSMTMGAFSAVAQGGGETRRIFKPFKVDVGINLTFPANTDLTVGGGFFVEPRYGVNDHIHVGLNLGSNIIGEGKSLFQNTEAVTRAQAIGNISLTGDYVFSLENVRPYIGMAAGMYRRSDYEIIDQRSGTIINNQGSHVNFGVAPRMGIVAGKFRMDATFHFTGKGITDFISIGLGIQFGGGRINYKTFLP